MSLKRRLNSLENKTKRYIEARSKRISKVITLTDEDVKQLIDNNIKPDEETNENIQFDLSLLSDEMLNRLEQYVISLERGEN